MGSPKTTALNAARLLDCRFLRIHADVGQNVDDTGNSGGTIRVNINAALNEKIDGLDADKVVASINIDLTGFPKEASGKPESFAFKIGLTLAGVFQWVTLANRPKNLKESPVAAHLCQQLYPMAIAEAKTVAQRLGFNNLDLPWQLGASPKKAAAPPAKPQRAKRTAAKKKAA
jgi:hypothetical protein